MGPYGERAEPERRFSPLEAAPLLHGVDVSACQPSYGTDVLDFVFIKATEGRSYVDPRLDAQVKRGRDVECVIGFHHFLRPGDVKDQVPYFLSQTPEKEGDPLAVDRERTGGGTRTSNADKDRFLREAKGERPGHRVLRYCNRAFWRTHGTSGYAGDGLWIADYVSAGKSRIEVSWRIHRCTDDPLDRNVADFGSARALRGRAAG